MKWFNNLKVSIKISSSCLLCVIIVVIIAVQGMVSIKRSSETIDKFYNSRFMPVIALNQINTGILQTRVNMLREFIAMQANDMKEFNARIESTRKIHSENADKWKYFTAIGLTGEEKMLADAFSKDYEQTRKLEADFADALKKKDYAAAAQLSDSWDNTYRSEGYYIDKFIGSQQKIGEEYVKKEKESESNTMLFFGIIQLLSVILATIIAIVLTRNIAGPVAKGLKFAKRLSEGDFTERIDLDQKDELGQLGASLNMAADNLENLIANSQTVMQSLAQAVEQISGGNQNLSQRTSEQASSLEEIASAIEQTTATIRQNAENALNANAMSEKTSKMARDGALVVNSAVNSINEISQSSKKIGEIISLINEISFQTNLLSLNAAVEAARAGEQGRGFAVVAGEVRNLAQRSATAAKEIGALINDSIDKIGSGTKLVNKSGEALKEIITAVTDVGKVISEIAAASQEQKQGIDQVNKAVTGMDTMTQQNAALVEETAVASEGMATQAQELLAMMIKFKVRNVTKTANDAKAYKSIPVKANDSTAHSLKKDRPKGKGKKHEIYAAETARHDLSVTMKQDGFEEF